MASTEYLLTWPGPGPERLDKALAQLVPEDVGLSRSRLSKLIAAGLVELRTAVTLSASARVEPGDLMRLQIPPPEPSLAVGEAIPLSIVYEDAHLLVVDKPAGMVVHPAPGSPSGTLVNALLGRPGGTLSEAGDARRPGIVHRIDKDTSGLLVVAKSDLAHRGLAAQFAAHSVERQYLALCHGIPSAQDPRLAGLAGVSAEPGGVLRIATLLGRHRSDRQRQAVLSSGGKPAVTRIKVEEGLGAVALVSCWLETGRTHQIRVHMAHIGHGLLGDPVYGRGRRLPQDHSARPLVEAMGGQALHAASLGFKHPLTDKKLSFMSKMPNDIISIIQALRKTIK